MESFILKSGRNAPPLKLRKPKHVIILKHKDMAMNGLVETLLTPLIPFLRMEDLKEISVLKEKTIALEIEGKGYVFKNVECLDFEYWKTLCHVLANMNGIVFHPQTHPILSTSLPDLEKGRHHRFEAMMGSCVEGGLSISIRIQKKNTKSLEDFGIEGDIKKKIVSFIKSQKSILISGGTSSGKTTLLNILGKEIPLFKRILTLEDTRELTLPHKNWKAYCMPRNMENKSQVYQALIDHLMRSRPDVILTGEVSLSNSLPILRILNTGHCGFMGTIHANSPQLALEKAFTQNLTLAGHGISGVADFLKKTIDLVIQVRSEKGDKKGIQECWYPGEKI